MKAGATSAHQVTQILHRIREGDRDALEELMPLIYTELRRIAGASMKRERPGHTLQPTALINEAFIKLFQDSQPQVTDRAHFLALMARVMRQVLVDRARAQATMKRGGRVAHQTWDTNVALTSEHGTTRVQLLDLHRALDALQHENPTLARVVEMHYFGGMTAEETATVLERTPHAVRHDIRLARAWLRREMAG